MNLKQFNQARRDYNRIPLVREVFADLDTPLSTYLKLADEPYTYLFESVQGGEKWGRYSIIGMACSTRLTVHGKRVNVVTDEQVVSDESVDDPLVFIEQFLQRYQVAEIAGLPKFHGGLVGYFGYDTIRYIEPKLAQCPNPDKHETPDILLMLSDRLVVFDNLASRMFLIVHVDADSEDNWQDGQRQLDELEHKLVNTQLDTRRDSVTQTVTEQDFTSEFSQQGFEAAVEKARQYIIDGDAMQISIRRINTLFPLFHQK